MNKSQGSGNKPANKFPGISFPWLIVALSALLMLSYNVYVNTFGVFFKPIAEDFGWSRAAMSGAYTIRCLVGAALVVPVGYLADRYGPRRVLLPSFILVGAGMMAIAYVTTLWQFYLVQGLGIGVGLAGPFVCIMSTVAKWHKTRRGLALGIAAAGSGLSSILFPPVATKLIEAVDWQFAILILGILVLVIGVSASFFIKDPPNEIKRPLPGKTSISHAPFTIWDSLLQFPRSPAFLAIIILYAFVGLAGNVLMNHLVNYATDIGLTALVAAGMMSAIGIASTSGRFFMGTISDKIGSRRDAAICCFLMAVAFILLISKADGLMWVAAVLFGIGYGGCAPLIPAIMVELVGTEELSKLTGIVLMGFFLGSALGPWLAGFIFDISGSYFWALLLAAGVSLAAVIIALRLPSGRQEISKTGYPLIGE
jgi:MFS family permease